MRARPPSGKGWAAISWLGMLAIALCAGCGKQGAEGATPVKTASSSAHAQAPALRLKPPARGAAARAVSSTQTSPAAYRTPQAPPAHAATSSIAAMPRIELNLIPFPASRKREMAAYARRHYGLDTYRLIHPRVIVEHYTETPDFWSTYDTFAPDHPDSELHELPNTCAHFVIDRAGVIHQLVPLTIMCRHTVGLNYTSIGIEHVGYSDREILDDPRELHASLALTSWLRCRYGIAVRNVIGHSESLSSPYHHENVPSLRTQTHSDWLHDDMNRYRALLGVLCRVGNSPPR